VHVLTAAQEYELASQAARGAALRAQQWAKKASGNLSVNSHSIKDQIRDTIKGVVDAAVAVAVAEHVQANATTSRDDPAFVAMSAHSLLKGEALERYHQSQARGAASAARKREQISVHDDEDWAPSLVELIQAQAKADKPAARKEEDVDPDPVPSLTAHLQGRGK
jgi:formaldehyde-activating enzyme involved in methanogenesis